MALENDQSGHVSLKLVLPVSFHIAHKLERNRGIASKGLRDKGKGHINKGRAEKALPFLFLGWLFAAVLECGVTIQ